MQKLARPKISCLRRQHLGRAAKILDFRGVVPVNNTTQQALEKLHLKKDELLITDILELSSPSQLFTENTIRDQLNALFKLSAAGATKMQEEHLTDAFQSTEKDQS